MWLPIIQESATASIIGYKGRNKMLTVILRKDPFKKIGEKMSNEYRHRIASGQ